MKNLVVQVADNKYLIRYKVLKSVVSRKHTTKEGKITNRLEKHPQGCEVHLYKIMNEYAISETAHYTRKEFKLYVKDHVTYLGRGLSKCSDKDKFNKLIGIQTAVSNIEDINTNLAKQISIQLILNF